MKPQAYSPEYGYKYQILCRNTSYDRAYEHCDYATDSVDKKHLLSNYASAYGAGWQFKSIMLPKKYWNSEKETKGLSFMSHFPSLDSLTFAFADIKSIVVSTSVCKKKYYRPYVTIKTNEGKEFYFVSPIIEWKVSDYHKETMNYCIVQLDPNFYGGEFLYKLLGFLFPKVEAVAFSRWGIRTYTGITIGETTTTKTYFVSFEQNLYTEGTNSLFISNHAYSTKKQL